MSSRRAMPRALLPAALALAATLAAGCVTTEPKPEEVQAQGLEHAPLPSAWSSKADSAASVVDGWIATFRDPQLEALVAEALAHNPDLPVAAARVEAAEAQ